MSNIIFACLVDRPDTFVPDAYSIAGRKVWINVFGGFHGRPKYDILFGVSSLHNSIDVVPICSSAVATESKTLVDDTETMELTCGDNSEPERRCASHMYRGVNASEVHKYATVCFNTCAIPPPLSISSHDLTI
jgi:hypothetical protein